MAKASTKAQSSVDDVQNEQNDSAAVKVEESVSAQSSVDDVPSISNGIEGIVSTGDNTPAQDIDVITVDTESSLSAITPTEQHLVKIQIGYPKDYQGDKFLIDGEVKEVSADVASVFVEKGIAKIVK